MGKKMDGEEKLGFFSIPRRLDDLATVRWLKNLRHPFRVLTGIALLGVVAPHSPILTSGFFLGISGFALSRFLRRGRPPTDHLAAENSTVGTLLQLHEKAETTEGFHKDLTIAGVLTVIPILFTNSAIAVLEAGTLSLGIPWAISGLLTAIPPVLYGFSGVRKFFLNRKARKELERLFPQGSGEEDLEWLGLLGEA